MKEQSYYFSHDSNAKDDPKCVSLIESLGMEGYGIFWVLVEILRSQAEFKYPIKLIPAIAKRYNTTTDKMNAVIYGYDLFIIEEDMFFSLSLIDRMKVYENQRLKKSVAGKIGMQKRWKIDNTVITPLLHENNTVITIKEKEKENKIKEENKNNIYSDLLENKSELQDTKNIIYSFKTKKSMNDKSHSKDYIITDQDILFLKNTFDLIDVDRELKKINIWLLSNPNKIKTYSNMPRFINGWLSKVQNNKEIYNGTNKSNIAFTGTGNPSTTARATQQNKAKTEQNFRDSSGY